MANLRNLQQAASEAAGRTPAAPRPPRPTQTVVTAPEPIQAKASSDARPSSRAGKIVLSFHLPEDFKRSMRLVQAYRGNGCTFEQLAAEAFNDLFAKYNVPLVNN